MGAWLSLPAQCRERAGQGRHRDAQVSDGHLRERLLLARPRRRHGGGQCRRKFEMLQNPEDQPGVLGEQDPSQPAARQGQLPSAVRQRLAGDSGLGVPAGAQAQRKHYARGGAPSRREAAIDLPQAYLSGRSLMTLLFGWIGQIMMARVSSCLM